jgi:hypothetical protein
MSFCSKVFNPNEQFVQRIKATGRIGVSDDDAGSPAISRGWSMLMRQLMAEERRRGAIKALVQAGSFCYSNSWDKHH